MAKHDEITLGDLARQYLAGLTVLPDPEPGEDELAPGAPERKFAVLLDRGVPRKLAREIARLDGHVPQTTAAARAALDWWNLSEGDTGRDVLALVGERGRGKSYAAANILGRIKPGTGQGCPRFASARSLSTWLHTSKDPESARNLERVKSAPVLVLDELGFEHLDRSGYTLVAIVGIIDDRIQGELRTILTSNMDEAGFQARYTDALHDRIRGYGVWVNVPPGESMR